MTGKIKMSVFQKLQFSEYLIFLIKFVPPPGQNQMSCNKFWVTGRETSTHSFEVFPYLSNAIVFYKLHSRSFQSFLHLVSRFKRYIGCLDGPLPTEHWGYWHQKRSRVNIWSPKISSYYYHKTNFKWKHHSRQQMNARQKIQTHYNWWYF